MYKLGKKRANPSSRDFLLERYLLELPVAPTIFGFGTLYTDWGILGNDDWGDCVFAGAAHETMIWNKLRKGHDVPFDPTSVLSDYSAVTGFDPSDPSTDQGTYTHQALAYRRKTGIVDSNGDRHKIAAYVSITPKAWDELITATYIFGAVGIGFEFPASAFDQFDKGEPWDNDDLDSPIVGGHYVPVVGTRDKSSWVACITWGKRQIMSKDFYEVFADEAWAMLSEEQIRSDGKGMHGFDLETLRADLAAL